MGVILEKIKEVEDALEGYGIKMDIIKRAEKYPSTLDILGPDDNEYVYIEVGLILPIKK